MSVVEFQVIGRKKPTATELHPKIYRMRLFAPNDTIAKSRFWYFMTKLNKIRGSQGEILAVNKVCPPSCLFLFFSLSSLSFFFPFYFCPFLGFLFFLFFRCRWLLVE